MSRLKLYLNRNILWAGLIAVIIPLLVMLWLQYRSLSQLEETSADANKLALKNHLKNISNEIQSYYQSNAERLLSIKSSELSQERISTPGCIFQNSWSGAKHFFVGAFMEDSEMKPYF